MAHTWGQLGGRRILVTGAASGIGAATAGLLTELGARVAQLDLDTTGLADLDGSVNVVADLRDPAAIAVAIDEAASALGGLDGLVNAAGVMQSGMIEEIDDVAWNTVIAVNLTAPFLSVRAALPHLRAAAPSAVVNVISGSCLRPYVGMSAYIASKGGLNAMSLAMASELGPDVRVNAVAPGATNTPMARNTFEDPQRLEVMRQSYALQKLGEPGEVADAIAFLLGPQAGHITGATLAVDGGRSFH